MGEVESVGGRSEPIGETAQDVLLECVLLVARSHGLATTVDALRAGLPLDAHGLTPSLVNRAARRIGFTSRVVRCPLDRVNPDLLPVILLLDENDACVLVESDLTANTARVVFPELGDAVLEVSLDRLRERYTGRTIYLRPRFRFDARTNAVRTSSRSHWFWGVVADNRSLYRDVLLAAFLINVFALAMPLFVLNVYDRVVPNNAIETLWVLSAGVLIVLIADFCLRTLRGRFVDLAASRIDVTLSADIMARVMGMRLEDRPKSVGSFAANLRAFESVRDFVSSSSVVAFIDLPFALMFIAVIGWIALPMVPIFGIAIVLLLIYTIIVQRRMHALSETAYRAGSQRNATLVEGLSGIETIKAIGAEGVIQRKWEQSAGLLAYTMSKLRAASASASNAATWLQHAASVCVIIVGVHLIQNGSLTAGGLIACYLLSSRAMTPVGQAANLLVQYHKASTALESLDKVMTREVERPEATAFISRKRFNGEIEFRKVGFSYPGSPNSVLTDVSFKIRAGERVAILGRVGSGKSTVEKLILGLYRPSEGTVLIDGIDVRQLDPAELRRNVGYVPQDATLFYGSLRENLTIVAPLADDEAVIEAARIAGLSNFVNRHPDGFEMQVGERGEKLSGGQRQEVALARALLHAPPVLLLDEPTAAMDQASETEVRKRLGEFAAGRTMVVVTHRTSLLEMVDRIIVLDQGRVVADGFKKDVVEALRQGRIGRVV